MPKAVDLSGAVAKDINRQHPEPATDSEPLPGPPARSETSATPPPPQPEPAPPPAAPPSTAPTATKTGRSRSTRPTRTAADAPERAKQLQVTVPRSLVERADQDDRSRSDILRHAFNRYADSLGDDSDGQEAPAGPMGAGRRARRKSTPDDPFITIMLRLTTSEIALLDELSDARGDSRSGLVSLLYRRELA